MHAYRTSVHESTGYSPFRLIMDEECSLPSGLTYRPDQSSVQTVLALGISSRPEVGSSAVAPSMDMEDSPLLGTGLPGCPYHFTPYSRQPFADGNPAFGLQIHHPWFLEFIGAPRSASLLYRLTAFWVDQLGKEQAMAAAVNLQWDTGIMLSNLQILSQFATSLHRMSSVMMDLGMEQMYFLTMRSLACLRRCGRRGRPSTCRPWTCGSLRRSRVLPDQYRLQPSAVV